MSNVCGCAETLLNIDGKIERVPKPKFHDCDYIGKRNQHVAEACRLADAEVASRHEPRWGAAYNRIMAELCADL